MIKAISPREEKEVKRRISAWIDALPQISCCVKYGPCEIKIRRLKGEDTLLASGNVSCIICGTTHPDGEFSFQIVPSEIKE